MLCNALLQKVFCVICIIHCRFLTNDHDTDHNKEGTYPSHAQTFEHAACNFHQSNLFGILVAMVVTLKGEQIPMRIESISDNDNGIMELDLLSIPILISYIRKWDEMWVWVGLGFVGWGWPHRDFPWVDGEIIFTD